MIDHVDGVYQYDSLNSHSSKPVYMIQPFDFSDSHRLLHRFFEVATWTLAYVGLVDRLIHK